MTPEQLSTVVRDALASAVDSGEVALADGLPDEVRIERPRARGHGDYATNVALQLAGRAGTSPRVLAETLASRLRGVDGIDAVDVAGPGFLNLSIAASAQGRLARAVVEAGQSYGRSGALSGQRVNLEFVSANPTGPVHIGHVRWAAVGDALGRLLEATGARVTREYYFNDAGGQIDRFAATLYAVARGEPIPAGGYTGAYINDIARQIVQRMPDVLDKPPDEALEVFRNEGVELMFIEIKSSLAGFGVVFDVYSNERDLHARGDVGEAIGRLGSQGHTYESDGALWLRTTDFGDDKDRVLIKRDGAPTYISVDAAYYLDKRRRGFERVVIMLGADHHGYVERYRALAAAFGDNPDETLEFLIGQLIRLVRDGQPVRLGKRAGNIVTLADLVDAVGVDAGRYALARYSVDSAIDLDLDLWARRTNDNPVFYVQYAHARTCNVTRNAADVGITLDATGFAPQLLDHPRESDLLGVLGEFPRVVTTAAELREVHRVARYLEDLAGAYHRWYDTCRVVPPGDEEVGDLNRTRLWLNEATRTVLANGLGLLGVTAPERM